MASSGSGEAALASSLSIATRELVEESQGARPGVEAQALRDRVQHRILQLEVGQPIEQDVVRHEEEIRVLKSAFNTIAPVAKLPLEVLGYIFSILRRDAKLRTGQHPDNRWLYLTHVCRLWRYAAMECAELWTTVDCSKNLDMAETMLRRSRSAPLEIKFNGDPGTMGAPLSLFRQCLLRVLSVTLHCNLDDDHLDVSSIISHFPERMPMLEKVEIYVLQYDPDDKVGPIPSSFLQGSAPALKSVHVTGRILWKAIPSPSSLANLTINNTDATRPAAASFLQSLSYAPQLQHLGISHFLPSDKYPSPAIPLSFMFLRSFEVKDTLPLIMNFLTSIKVMAAFKITFRIEGGSQPFPLLGQCFGVLSKAWVGPPNSSRARGQAQRLELRRWTPTCRWPPQLDYFFGQGEQCCELRVLFPTGFTPKEDILNSTFIAITEAFGHSEVSSLSLRECFSTPQSIWNSVLGLLPNLEVITLIKTLPRPLVAILKDESNVDPHPPLSSLSHIRVSGALYPLFDLRQSREFSTSVLSLAELLAKRAETSFAIQELRVSSSSFHKDAHSSLLKLSPPLNLVTDRLRIIDL